MACVPSRAGSHAARQLSVGQGVQLSEHCKMKQNLLRSSLWHKTCKSRSHVWHVRNMASEAVVIEEMEASDFNEKKTMRWQRWQVHETMVLIAAKKQQVLWQTESTEAAGIESKKAKNKWKEIEALCQEKGIERSAEQCQTRWSRLTSAYTQIRSWEENKTPEQSSFWSMKLEERKSKGFALILDQKTYNALNELNNSRGDAIKNTMVEDDVEEEFELGSIDHTPQENDRQNYKSGEAHKGNDLNNALTSGLKNDGEVQAEILSVCKFKCEGGSEMYIQDADGKLCSEQFKDCEGEKRADSCKDMEITNDFSTSLHDNQIEVDGSITAQLLHASAGKMDCSHQELHSSQHAEGLETTERDADGKFCSKDCEGQKRADPCEDMESTNIFSTCLHDDQMEVDGSIKAQLLHASAGKMDCSHKELHTSQHAEDLGTTERTNIFSTSLHDDQIEVDGSIKAQLLHASALKMDCSHNSIQDLGTTEHDNLMFCGNEKDVNNIDIAQLFHASKEMDDSNKDQYKRHLEGQGIGEHINVMPWDDNNSQFSPVMYDGTMPAARDKGIEEKSKGADGISLAYHETNFSLTDSLEAGPTVHTTDFSAPAENPGCQKTFSHLLSFRGVDFLDENQSDPKEGTGRDSVFEHGPEDDNTLPLICSSESSESTSSTGKTGGGVEDMDFQKNQSQSSREGHIKMTAGMEGMTSGFEHNIGHIFKEKRVGELQNGTDEYNGKTTEHSQNIEVAVDDKDLNDPTDRLKVVINEGVYLTEMIETRASPDSSALSSIQHQFHHAGSALEHKGSIKGDGVSFGKQCEVKRVEASETAAAEVGFVIKDGRGSPVASGKGAREDQSQKSNKRNKYDEDVFLYIPAAIGSLVRSVVQTIRKFLKF